MSNVGHNGGPELVTFQTVSEKIDGLYAEAKNWCDGEPLTTQAQADDVSRLMNMIRAAEKEARALMKEEKEPFDVELKEIADRYNRLIGKTSRVTGKTVTALDACKAVMAPWLIAQESAKREAEEKARREAEDKRRAAAAAHAAAEASNLAAREHAERLEREAAKAERAAKRAINDKAKASGGAGRATTLRTRRQARVDDYREFARWVWVNKNEEMRRFLEDIARKEAASHAASVPGVTFLDVKEAV